MAAFDADGVVIAAISDDFEAPNWNFDRVNNISSNGLWFGSSRGIPTVLQRVTPPAGGPLGNTGALRIRTNDIVGDLTQDDLVTKRYTQTPYGKDLTLADAPSYELLLNYPSISQWKDGSAIGFRTRAKDVSLISPSNSDGAYYPSIWVVKNGYNIELFGRVGDDLTPDFSIKIFPGFFAGRIKLGITWNSRGQTKYYASFGSGPLTEANLLRTDTFSGRTMDTVSYHFLSIAYPAKSGLSPDFIIDHLKVYKFSKGL